MKLGATNSLNVSVIKEIVMRRFGTPQIGASRRRLPIGYEDDPRLAVLWAVRGLERVRVLRVCFEDNFCGWRESSSIN